VRKATATTKVEPESKTEPRARRAEAAPGSLVVVSNRLPFTTVQSEGRVRFKRSPGGLVAALDPALSRRGGVWVGWPGVETEEAVSTVEMQSPRSSKVRYRSVPLSRREVALYYGGFSNRTLWPLFHYFLGRTEINAATWAVYERVNERFAQAAATEGDGDALVWVHDYQLLRMPRYLRRLVPQRRIAFFLHIPFPAHDVFRILPWARSIMRGMLSCDLVGFQSGEHAEHFVTCAERLLGCDVDRAAGMVQFEGRPVSARTHPIGIDVAHIEKLAQRVETAPAGQGEPVVEILGLDRLDYTKGIPERLHAVELFFERYPAYRGRTVFVQLAVPSRTGVAEYQALKREVDEMVGRINGRFSDRGWSPIRYLVRSVGQDELVAMYRNAKVALVTPLRDGMNLVAKEYVASQLDNDGVLILSELAGAAEELKEAILVNPYDVDEVVEALRRALSIPEDERRARMLALRHRVRAGGVQRWVQQFVAAAERAAARRERAAESGVLSPTDIVRGRLHKWLAQRPTVALFFDYDGTLTPITKRPEEAVLSPTARRLLRQAARTPNLDVAIVSGRSLEEVRKLVGLPGLTYVGNHGFEIEGPGISFRHESLDKFEGKVRAAAEGLAKLGVAEARIERKGAALSYYTREVKASERAALEARAAAILRRNRLRVSQGKCVVEGRPPVDWNKGYAVLTVLARRHGTDWSARVRALYLGDDATDEDAFRSLKGIGRSVRVGETTQTAADFALPTPDSVIELLRWLSSGAFESDEG
jgi:trehalose 6-phosphate synthase/phosphatase